MAEIVGIVIPVVTPLVQPVMDLLKAKCKAGKRSLSLADAHEVLNFGLRRLGALRRDKENQVLISFEHDPTEVYKIWENDVSNIEVNVTSLNTDYEKVKEKIRRHPERSRLKEKIKEALSRVFKLLGDQCLEDFLGPKLPERVIKEIGVQPIEEYRTLKEAFDDIQKQLQTQGVNCVALSGQKGVGKTTIMQHLNNHYFDNKEFDMVIFIKVAAAEHTDPQILHKIADRIKVDREATDFDEVARRIQKVLENKRYLLILDGLTHTLDGIWGALDLLKHRNRKDNKVVIASHYPLAVISTCVEKVVELNKLSDTEARKMFLNIVGKCLPQAKALQICDRLCCRLPLLIYPIARSFKYHAPITGLQQALDQWTPWPEVGVEGIKELYSNLKICYERLRDPSEQKCFLYASLHPANSKIYTHYFVECCIVQELLEKTDATAKYSGMRSPAIDETLKHLVNVAFLEEGEAMRYVKMNDLFRQLALYISSNDSNSKFKTHVDNEEAITSASCQPPIWLSMVGSKKNSLPANQDFSSLQTLLLQKNLELAEISEDCLSSMTNLLVLNLYGTKIRKLPYLSKLAKLKAFYVNGCSDLDIELSQIESLKCLQVLDIRGAGINSVPCLTSLWCLRMSFTKIGDCDRISELKNLEELTIEVKSPVQWCDGAKCIVEKVASLKNLTTFGCSFPSLESLTRFKDTSKSWRSEQQLLHFKFFVGCEDSKSWSLLTTDSSST